MARRPRLTRGGGSDRVDIMEPQTLLLVDDNPNYRSAFRRNLEMEGYRVLEAENASEAMSELARSQPAVVITDLDMTHRTEGLDLIRECKRHYPLLPVILISAVGTFDEGALAQQFGASAVLSKSRIEEAAAHFCERLQGVVRQRRRVEEELARAEAAPAEESARAETRARLAALLSEPDLDAGCKGALYEAILSLETRPDGGVLGRSTQEIERRLAQDLPQFAQLTAETREMIVLADDLYFRGEREESVSISRNIGFSYTFAVECEIKHRINKKIVRLLADKAFGRLLDGMMDARTGGLDLFFNQYVIQATRQLGEDLNADIARQVLGKMRELRTRYKADGLKALGVIVFLFGRNYAFKTVRGEQKVANPLGLKGLSEEETLVLADMLVRLQHLRNPYVHPEFTAREKAGKLRETALECLALILRLY